MPTTILLHPLSGCVSFGLVPTTRSRGALIQGGEIRLLRGVHTGPHRGYGARHIWAEHQKEMRSLGLLFEGDVPAYVAHIIRPGAPLYYGGETIRRVRLMAVRAAAGIAILEFREQRNTSFWSVVTAFSGSKKHGTLIGTVLF